MIDKSCKIFLFLCFLLPITLQVSAQNIPVTAKPLPAALPVREINGLIKDTTDTRIPYVTVKLVSMLDTMATITNSDGVFKFNNVKSATYTLTITCLGYKPMVGKYEQNDAIPRIVMSPIILGVDAKTIAEVVIKGAPSITYKVDTVEYRARDYIVRAHATVDELLRKMEGMDVSSDGKLKYQGTDVKTAKLNGKVFLDGGIASTIKNLPAEIVNKIQIVDDYGDEAARTGIKDGIAQKILNIVTKTDKSIGNMVNIDGGAGNDDRYEGNIFAARVNGNRTIGLDAKFNNSVIGVGSGTGATINVNNANDSGNMQGDGASSGNVSTGNASLSYRDQLNKKIHMNTSYAYNSNDVRSTTSSLSQLFSSLGTTFSKNESNSNMDTKTHALNVEIEADLNKYNFLKITPTVNKSFIQNNSQFNTMQNGLITQDQTNKDVNANESQKVGLAVFFQHFFLKPRRNISFQLSVNSAKQADERDRDAHIVYYPDNRNVILKDSLIHRLVERNNLANNYRGSVTLVEPINDNTQIEFNGQVGYNDYNNRNATQRILPDGSMQSIDSLRNDYDYSFMQARIGLNYRYGVKINAKFNFSLGITGIPTVLHVAGGNLAIKTKTSSFNLIPIARILYAWSNQHFLRLNYSGNASEPAFNQLQPFRDISDPQNVIIGNPDLKIRFNHVINTIYDNYIGNTQLYYSIGLNVQFIENAVSRNITQIADSYNSLKNEIRYVNVHGVHRINSHYVIAKRLNNKKYNLSYSGDISHVRGVSMSNNIENISSIWSLEQTFGPRINPTDWFEINPSISYMFTKFNNSLPTSFDSRTNILALNIDGAVHPSETLSIRYSASKNFVRGINANLTNNPFIINGNIEKEFWNGKAKLSLQVIDILNQNNFINRNITDQGITDTKSNSLSRYFMLHFAVRLQKWTGYKAKEGTEIIRRGDGSFN